MNNEPTEADKALAKRLCPFRPLGERSNDEVAQLIASFRAEQTRELQRIGEIERTIRLSEVKKAQEHAARLLAERDQLIKDNEFWVQSNNKDAEQIAQLQQQLATLRSQLAEARKDGERLDWLEKNTYRESGNCDRNSEGAYRMYVKDGTDYYKCTKQLPLRASIDAARNSEGKA